VLHKTGTSPQNGVIVFTFQKCSQTLHHVESWSKNLLRDVRLTKLLSSNLRDSIVRKLYVRSLSFSLSLSLSFFFVNSRTAFFYLLTGLTPTPSIIQAELMVGMFADQIFRTGFIHGDPHCGNLLVRKEKGTTQIVCLDHGMYFFSQRIYIYIYMYITTYIHTFLGMYQEFSDSFRMSYAELWRAMSSSDEEALVNVCKEWGIADTEMFATLQLLKPYSKKKAAHIRSTTRAEIYKHTLEMRVHGYERAKRMLQDSEKVPRELVFLGRQMNIVRANNAAMGSPANRAAIMARCAARQIQSWGVFGYFMFVVRLMFLDAAFWMVQTKRRVEIMLGRRSEGFEELLERRLADALEEQTGIRLNIRPGETWEEVSGA
jgi:aarF domain-containing kinase